MMPDPKTYKQHFENKHPKNPLPADLLQAQAQAKACWRSAGKGFLGCLFSKCCLYVFGSGIIDLHTEQHSFNPAMAAFFWSFKLLPSCFFNLAAFSAAFCCDWIFC